MSSDLCGSRLFLDLDDDIFSVITSSISPRDVCSLVISCPRLDAVLSSDQVWLAQCDKLGLLPFSTLIEWRKGVSSYKALCRFLVNIHPLIGIWVHINPELGNVVYVMPGFLSVVGCRIIPQRIGPLGLEDGPILWTSVFEILCNYDGSTTFFLHGRERGEDCVYPGLLKSVDRNCNELSLEVEPLYQLDGGKWACTKSFDHEADNEVSQRMVGRKGTEIPFSRLETDDRSMLLDLATRQVRHIVPDIANAILFPCLRNGEVDHSQQDFEVLHERRLLLLQMYKRALHPTELGSSDVCKSLDCTSGSHGSQAGDMDQVTEQILRKSSSTDGDLSTLHEFLRSGDGVRLCLRTATAELDDYKAWPSMHESQSILYKIPVEPPKEWHKYAGLWGGTYGWPPRRLSEEKSGKALFLILISYEELEGKQCMIGTKILEGSFFAARPNGSPMFTMNIYQPALELFPCDSDEDSDPIDSFGGEGIASGYGFRYPGSQPGSLYVLPNGLLVFVYKESRGVLTLQRFDLADLLRRGERVPSLPPSSNFAYLMREYRSPYSEFSDS